MKVKITKSYDRKVSYDYNSWGFSTSLDMEIEVEKLSDVPKISDEVFKQVKYLVERDIEVSLPSYLQMEQKKLAKNKTEWENAG